MRGPRGPWKPAALVAAGAIGGGAALAVAAVPDGGGAIHACLQLTRTPSGATVPDTSAPNLTVIDPSAGQHCVPPDPPVPNQTELTWNQTGPRGATGATGARGATGATGATGVVKVVLPTVRASSPALGRIRLGSGRDALSFPYLGYSPAAAKKGKGRVSIGEITITKKVDKSSPVLFRSLATGKHFPTVTITARKTGTGTRGRRAQYLTITLRQVLVSSFRTDEGSGAPLESVVLSYPANRATTR